MSLFSTDYPTPPQQRPPTPPPEPPAPPPSLKRPPPVLNPTPKPPPRIPPVPAVPENDGDRYVDKIIHIKPTPRNPPKATLSKEAVIPVALSILAFCLVMAALVGFWAVTSKKKPTNQEEFELEGEKQTVKTSLLGCFKFRCRSVQILPFSRTEYIFLCANFNFSCSWGTQSDDLRLSLQESRNPCWSHASTWVEMRRHRSFSCSWMRSLWRRCQVKWLTNTRQLTPSTRGERSAKSRSPVIQTTLSIILAI